MPLRPLLDELAEAILPQRCVACGRFGAALHAECVAMLIAAEGARCERCWAPAATSLATPAAATCAACHAAPPAFEALRARFRFEGDVRRALLEAKFRGKTTLLRPLAEAAVEAIPGHWDIEAVVPVPLHRARQRQRGYNQAALIGETLARSLDVPYRPDLLRRARGTRPQATLAAEARSRNLLDAFEVRGPLPDAVLLVDDITTTGATFEAAARALRAGGVGAVFALAIARED